MCLSTEVNGRACWTPLVALLFPSWHGQVHVGTAVFMPVFLQLLLQLHASKSVAGGDRFPWSGGHRGRRKRMSKQSERSSQ